MKILITTILIIIMISSSHAQYDVIGYSRTVNVIKLTTIKDYNLNGKVKSITQSYYVPQKKNNQIVIGESFQEYSEEDGEPCGELKSGIDFDYKGRVTSEGMSWGGFEYSYDAEGQIHSTAAFGMGYQPFRLCYIHSDKGRIISAYPEDKSNNNFSIIYYYDKNDNLIKKKYADRSERIQIVEYIYDSNGMLTQIITSADNKQDVDICKSDKIIERHTYDIQGKLINIDRNISGFDENIYVNQYLINDHNPKGEFLKHDKYGNWTWCLTDNASGLHTETTTPKKILIIRELEYYK